MKLYFKKVFVNLGVKFLSNNKIYGNQYYLRTSQQQEVDYVEEIDGKFFAYEIKWNPKKKVKFPKPFIDTYKPKTQVINKENFKNLINEELNPQKT